MHPSLSYSPVTANLLGFASNVTGATWVLSATTVGDAMAHTVTVRNDSITDHSAKTMILTGTDQDNIALTETLAMPGASATVTSLKYFKTLTTVVPSATIGADTMDIGWSAVSYSPTIPLDWQRTEFGVSLALVITGTVSVTVQQTYDYLSVAGNAQGAVWFDHATLAAKTASADGSYAFPVIATHLKINSVTNGAVVVFKIVQGTTS